MQVDAQRALLLAVGRMDVHAREAWGLDTGYRRAVGAGPALLLHDEHDQIEVMCALELLLDVAYHDGTPRDLAVAAEAWSQAGYNDGSISISHSGRHEDLQRTVAIARYRRNRKLLQARATGMLQAVQWLARAGLLPGAVVREQQRQRWVARGGHDRA